MRLQALTAALLVLGLVCTQSALAGRVEQDVGILESTSDDKILVQGSRGLHVFESVHVCTWCQAGVEVVVTFTGYGRATLRPSEKLPAGGSLEVLIVRDGRQ